ncbi:hypothetical protein K8R61_02705 [bacterium]|nr:hypothetical protein [bacterium]
MKTKKNYLFIIIVLLIFTWSGCTNCQESSREEAIFVVQKLPDFKKNIQYFSISSGYSIILSGDPFIYKVDESSKKNEEIGFIHIVIYEKKEGGQKIVFLDDNRPPQIALKQSLK